MNDPWQVFIACVLCAAAGTVGFSTNGTKISKHCQNYGKFVVADKVYECKEAGVAK